MRDETFKTTKVPLIHPKRETVFRAAPNQPNRLLKHGENLFETILTNLGTFIRWVPLTLAFEARMDLVLIEILCFCLYGNHAEIIPVSNKMFTKIVCQKGSDSIRGDIKKKSNSSKNCKVSGEIPSHD